MKAGTNICTLTDGYKLGHPGMMLPGTESGESYFEPRTGALFPETTFVGLQMLIMNHLEGQVVTKEKIDKAEKFAKRYFGNDEVFDRSMWDYILEKYDGYLPLEIEAVPEGTVVPVSNALMVIRETDPKCVALRQHVETLLTHVWGPSTVASLSRATKEVFKKYLNATCDEGENFAGIDFMLHDFGMRGVSSMESAGMLGLGHMVNFLGTDTIIALEYIEEYYDAEYGFSVPATEHSVMTQDGKEGEEDVVEYLLKKYTKGILSIVCDSYSDENFVRNIIGKKFKDLVLARDGKTVVRPDSGDPVTVMLKLINILGEEFGYTVNDLGFKVLNPKVGIIWGDGIDYNGVCNILEALKEDGWSAENAVFGMGGGLLQKINRDTQRFAFKSCAQQRDGMWRDVYKDPIDGSKSSKRGKLVLLRDEDGNYSTVRRTPENEKDNVMKVVYRNGVLLKKFTFDEVVANSNN